MADGRAARDEDRLPWLEPFGEGERSAARKPVPRTALVGLLVAFFGVGLAVAFSLGYRVAEASRRGARRRSCVERQPERDRPRSKSPLAARAGARLPRRRAGRRRRRLPKRRLPRRPSPSGRQSP